MCARLADPAPPSPAAEQRWQPFVAGALALLALCLPRTAAQQATEEDLAFLEAFAFGNDRAAALERLLPGSDASFFYRCLQLQHEGRLELVPAILATWIERHNRTTRVREIELRQALLQADSAAYARLRTTLGLRFDQRRDTRAVEPGLPTSLDQGLVSRQVFMDQALSGTVGDLSRLNDGALVDLLERSDLPDARVLPLLARLKRPDHPAVVGLVARGLDLRESRGFGSLRIHGQLLATQLDSLLLLHPELIRESTFVAAVAARLRPPEGVDLEHDHAARRAWLERLERFSRELPAVHNSLKAQVLHQLLLDELSHEGVSAQRLLEYLALPRRDDWRLASLASRVTSSELVRLGFDTGSGLPNLASDEQLLRDCLEQRFASGDKPERYTAFLRDDFVVPIYAETRLLYGLGDDAASAALLDDPKALQRLRDRVEIRFARDQVERFEVGQPVQLDVDVKHVGSLLVKVFAIDSFGHYAATGAEVDTQIDLNGLVPHHERSLTIDAPDLRRVRRRLELPEISGPGVWVVELVGGGLISRAVVRVGQLGLVERVGAAGHVLAVLDDDGSVLTDASLWLDGRQFEADADGEILVPFSTSPAERTVILRHGDRASLARFAHRDESYELHAGLFVDREALLVNGTATIVVRPSLWVCGQPAPLALLEKPRLEIVARDVHGATTRLDRNDLLLVDDAETVLQLPVPEDLVNLELTLVGTLSHVSRETEETLRSAALSVPLNVIDSGDAVVAALLAPSATGFTLELRGKNGEPLGGRGVQLELNRRDFVQPVRASLQTDAGGRIALGALAGIETLRWADQSAGYDRWELPVERAELPDQLLAAEGESVRLPVHGSEPGLSLLETRRGVFVADLATRARLADGVLTLSGLPAGHYDLWLPASEQQMQLEVLAGERKGDWIVGPRQRALAPRPSALQITTLGGDDDALVVQLAGAGPETRLHVLATRYLPALDPGLALASRRSPAATAQTIERASCTFSESWALSDEARYVLERRHAPRFPGNLLPRPGLVLNPWSRDESFSSTGLNDIVGVGGGGGGGSRKGAAGARSLALPTVTSRSPQSYADLDFLAEPSVLLTNLRPDADGRVRVARNLLGDAQLLSLVAVDGEACVTRALPLPARPLTRRDRRLPGDLVLAADAAEQRRIDVLAAGQRVVFEDVATTEAELYATLGDVFGLFSLLGDGEALRPFGFLVEWPELSRDDKLERYDRFACHELHLFLHQKDRAFFDEVVRPYLANKRDKTFLDHWLLDHDLSAYAEPWRYAQLNVVERILLGRRLPGLAASVQRQLADRLALDPTDPARTRARFELALRGGAARRGDSLGRELATATAELMALGYLGEALEEDAFYYANGLAADEDFNLLPSAAAAGTAAPPNRSASPGLLTGRGRKTGALDLERRQSYTRLYSGPGRTHEYVENNYWHVPIANQGSGLIRLNPFWVELAATPAGQPFVSAQITEPVESLHAMLLALALLDLPFEAAPAERQRDGHRLELTASGPSLLVNSVLRATPAAADPAPLLISQDLYRLDTRFVFDGSQRRDAFVGGELLAGVPYGCQVVLTNPGSSPRQLELLVQIPEGALPVRGGEVSQGLDLELQAFATRTVDVAFYFPSPGRFRLAPARASEGGSRQVTATPRELDVVAQPTSIDTQSWEHVSQDGSLEQVLAFLEGANLGRVPLERIAWRLSDRAAFDAVVALLGRRLHGDSTVWSFGLLHEDPATTRQFLAGLPIAEQCGRWLDAPLLSLDPVERHTYEQVDFAPLINARAHPHGGARAIRDGSLERQYRELLTILCYRPALDDDDHLAVLYHLLLQDRIVEALEQFAAIDPDALEARLQYDYVAAYLGFFGEDPRASAALAQAHAQHPVARWRERFGAVLAQLAEAAALPGDVVAQTAAGDDAEVPAALELALVDGRVVLRSEGLASCELRFTPMDVELLFSMRPFGDQGAGGAASVEPHERRTVALSPGGTTEVELPAAFARRNVLVEARAGGLSRREVHYAHDLSVQLLEERGELTVRDPASGRPLPGVYVKVYASGPGGERFHKDGYTDLRGRFDYVAVSSPDTADAQRFAVLVLDDARGAVVREAAAPLR